MQDNDHQFSTQVARIFSALFFSSLVVMGLVSLFTEPDTVSVTENRALAPMPKFSVWSLFSGSYTDSLELYYADNFPARESLVTVATSVRDLSGYRSEVVYYRADKPVETPVVPVVPPVDTAATAKPDLAAVKAQPDTTKITAEYDKAAGVIVYDNRAIQLFTGSGEGARKYAEMVNLYRSTFDSLSIFCMVAPTAIDFYLPDDYKKSSNYEYKTINLIRDSLYSDVQFVNVYDELKQHTREYIFFNTDHHWTGRGAYYAYVAFCKSAGFTPVEMKDFDRKQVKKTFLGSLYGITLDKGLRNNRDSVEYFKPKLITRTFRYDKDSARYRMSRLFSNTHNYAKFIGGDHPMVRIESDVNADRILIIKDSFGNAVAPFLALHYGTVYVMDYRYFDINVKEFVKQHGISAILFLHNTFAANSKFTAYRGRYVLDLKTVSEPQQKIVTDSTTTKRNDE